MHFAFKFSKTHAGSWLLQFGGPSLNESSFDDNFEQLASWLGIDCDTELKPYVEITDEDEDSISPRFMYQDGLEHRSLMNQSI
jgi:hypothetical protein